MRIRLIAIKTVIIFAAVMAVVSACALVILLGAHQLRAEFTQLSRLHETTCRLDPNRNRQECEEFAELTDALMHLSRELSTTEVAYCSILGVVRLGAFNSTCGKYQIALDLKNEIEILSRAVDVFERNN